MTVRNPETLDAQPKRTRVCGPQSKTGCFTCKARRIKCDEKKPACVRCTRSYRLCEGYPDPARSTGFSRTVSSASPDSPPRRQDLVGLNPMASLRDGCRPSLQQDRFARLGCILLGNDSYGPLGASGSLFGFLLPQLSYAIPSVNSATAALGAVYELQHSSASEHDRSLAVAQYLGAIRATQNDLLIQPYGSIPVLLMCLLLAITELLLRQQHNALFHLRGALKVLEESKRAKTPESPETLQSGDTDPTTYEDAIELLFRTFVFISMEYAPSLTPAMPDSPLPRAMPITSDIKSAHRNLIHLVHGCHSWITKACHFTLIPKKVNRELLIEQGRYVAHLSLWLETFNGHVLPQYSNTRHAPSQTYAHALTLRMICLATLIWVSQVLNPYESAYDFHIPRFQQIILDATQVVACRNRERSLSGLRSPRLFVGPGILQPLYFTSTKYRHPVWRRRAIALMRQTSREGPWNGPRAACISLRAAEIEEAWPESPLPPSDRPPFDVFEPDTDDYTAISEQARLQACGMDAEEYDRGAGFVTALFVRCADIESMISCPDEHVVGPNSTCKNKSHWELWQEELSFEKVDDGPATNTAGYKDSLIKPTDPGAAGELHRMSLFQQYATGLSSEEIPIRQVAEMAVGSWQDKATRD